MGLDRGLHTLMDTNPLVVIALIILVEEAGVPSPIPGDLMMILAGVKVAQGVYPLWLVLLVQEIVTLLGTAVLYTLTRRAGRPVIERYGKYVHLGPETLARAEGQIRRSGGRAIVLGRLIPGLRIITPVAAGTLGVTPRRFFPAVALGAFIYLFVLTLAGRIFGNAALAGFERVTRVTGALVSLLVLLGLVLLTRQIAEAIPSSVATAHATTPAAIGVGLLAGVLALLAANSAVELVTFGARLLGKPAPAIGPVLTRAQEISTGWHLLLGWPGFMLLAGIIGAVANVAGGSHLSRLEALVFGAAVPFGLTLLALSPVVAHPPAGLARSSGAVLIAIEGVRWLAYGIALGSYIPVVARLHPGLRDAPRAPGHPEPVSRADAPPVTRATGKEQGNGGSDS